MLLRRGSFHSIRLCSVSWRLTVFCWVLLRDHQSDASVSTFVLAVAVHGAGRSEGRGWRRRACLMASVMNSIASRPCCRHVSKIVCSVFTKRLPAGLFVPYVRPRRIKTDELPGTLWVRPRCSWVRRPPSRRTPTRHRAELRDCGSDRQSVCWHSPVLGVMRLPLEVAGRSAEFVVPIARLLEFLQFLLQVRICLPE